MPKAEAAATNAEAKGGKESQVSDVPYAALYAASAADLEAQLTS